MEAVQLTNPIFGEERWRRADDPSGEVFFAWDEIYLYFAVECINDCR